MIRWIAFILLAAFAAIAPAERVVDPPDVMFTTRDGYCAGLPEFERFIKMASTHGSLNQINSATFLMTMMPPAAAAATTTPTQHEVLPTRDVMKAIEPAWVPR